MTPTRAADDFVTIRARMEELRRAARPAPLTILRRSEPEWRSFAASAPQGRPRR